MDKNHVSGVSKTLSRWLDRLFWGARSQVWFHPLHMDGRDGLLIQFWLTDMHAVFRKRKLKGSQNLKSTMHASAGRCSAPASRLVDAQNRIPIFDWSSWVPDSQRLGIRPHAYTNGHRPRSNFICPLPRILIQRFVDVISDFGHKLRVQSCYFALNMSRHICFQESYCVHHLLHYIVVSPIRSHHLFIFHNICVLFETKPEECSLLAPPLRSKSF
jgi:hypothetical protein